jgi:hypothetical protein
MIRIYLCSEFEFIKSGKFLNSIYKNDYPGVAVWHELACLLNEREIELLPAEKFVSDSINYSPKASFFIQEENARSGRKLFELGVKPIFIFSGESPLFAPKFYRNLEYISDKFPYRLLFKGAHKFTNGKGINETLEFPSFDYSLTQLSLPNKSAKLSVAVLSNKYWQPNPKGAYGKAVSVLNRFGITLVPRYIRENQLHYERLKVLQYGLDNKLLELHGAGWQDTSNLPSEFNLGHHVSNVTPLSNKQKEIVLKNYKFGFAMENMIFDGYVTEKLFGFLSAGVVPIYLGTPSIIDNVPKEVFIDYFDFSTPQDLFDYLREMDEETYLKYLAASSDFLRSKASYRYSYQGVAMKMMKIILDVIN